MELRARTLWLRTEPLHAVVYFDEQCRAMGRSLGLKGFWMGYFAARTAPMGAVEPSPATAVLAVFAPGMVSRALPAAWETVAPAQVIDQRAHGAARALRALDPGIDDRAVKLSVPMLEMVERAPAVARPLFTANRALCDREDPVEQLWQLTTALREFRGDAHAAVLADHGLDGCEALWLAAATDRVPRDGIRLDRGWSEEEWEAARDRLRSRALLDADGEATVRGREERQRIEDTTDRLAAQLLRPLSDPASDALFAALEPVVHTILAADVLPFPNPIGLPRPA
ncbi:SCO6745 family protein [Streptomyces sp. 8N706]|uniref:SCO6745 family protein n=1 Tax=Streptomyces sp. 8N706 TaxID=3457416 RepID=UPI003FCF33DF